MQLFPSTKWEFLNDLKLEFIDASQVPQPFKDLLCHENNLTAVLEKTYGGLNVEVLETYITADEIYNRLVNLNSPSGRILTHALLSVNLQNLPESMREAVKEGKVPFGRLLRKHVRERRVQFKACWKVGSSFNQAILSNQKPSTYARTVVIVCNGLEAAEVLEIIVPELKKTTTGPENGVFVERACTC